MTTNGYAPSTRLFEAAACGTAVISDPWEGLDQFFQPGREILVAANSQQVRAYLEDFPDEERKALAQRARQRVLQNHTAEHRVQLLERLVKTSTSKTP
jgi:spore maturation protein CgeB